MKTLIPFSLLALTLALGACSTIDSRIHEKAPLFYSLDQNTQAKIAHGDIEVGYSPDMVYIALGQPDAKRLRATADGATETWVYNTYYDRYEGTADVGYRRWVAYDRGARVYHVYWTPVYEDLYSTQTEERIRVTFHNGKVTSIDQTKDEV